MQACLGVARIALAHLTVGDIAVNTVLGQRLQAALAVVAGIRQEGRAIGAACFTNGREMPAEAIDHRFEQVVFLRRAVGLRFHDHLMLTIHGGDTDIALHDAVAGLEGGAVGIGQVALDRLALGTEAFGRVGQGRAQLAGIPAQSGEGAFFVFALTVLVGIECLAGILLGMHLDQMGDGAFHLRRLALEVRPRAAPFPGGIRGQLAAIDGEHGLADQALCVADHQYIAKHRFDLLAQRRHEVRQGGEVGLLVTGQGNEGHVLDAGPRHRARGGDAPRVGKQHHLEQHRRIVGRRTGVVVLEPGRKASEIDLVVDQVVQRVLEGPGQQLPAVGHRDHLGLLRVVVPVSRHRRFASFSALLPTGQMIGCGEVFLQLR